MAAAGVVGVADGVAAVAVAVVGVVGVAAEVAAGVVGVVAVVAAGVVAAVAAAVAGIVVEIVGCSSDLAEEPMIVVLVVHVVVGKSWMLSLLILLNCHGSSYVRLQESFVFLVNFEDLCSICLVLNESFQVRYGVEGRCC